MISRYLGFLVLIITCFSVSAKTELKTENDKLSYSFGASFGKDIKNQGVEVNPEIFYSGLLDGMKGKSQLTQKEIEQSLTAFQERQFKKHVEMMKQKANNNLKKSNDFLEKNKQEKDIIVLPSGLQYKVIKKGKGKKPTTKDTVTVNYKGMLIDGTEFDSSYKRNEPTTFPLTGVIAGWQEGLQLMNTGSIYKFFIPPKLGYGEQGINGVIEPNSALIFEVELLKFEKTPIEEKS